LRKKCSPRNERPIGAPKLRPVVKDIAVDGVDAIEDPMAARENTGELEPCAPGQRLHERPPDSSMRACNAQSRKPSARAICSSQRSCAICVSATPKRARSSCGRYTRPLRQSTAMSCQKLTSCSALQIASLFASFCGVSRRLRCKRRRPIGLAERRQ
jgi:hypothetical protein